MNGDAILQSYGLPKNEDTKLKRRKKKRNFPDKYIQRICARR
jgi:hypothetical protein